MINIIFKLLSIALIIATISCSSGKKDNFDIIEENPSIFNGLVSDNFANRYESLVLVKENVANYVYDNDSMLISEAAIPYIFDSLSFGNKEIEWLAIDIIYDYVGKTPNIYDYIYMYLWEVKSEIRIAFIHILARTSDGSLITTFKHPYLIIDVAAKDVDMSVRIRAIELIGEYRLRPKYCIYELVEMFKREGQSNEIKIEIIRTMGRYGKEANKRAVDFLHDIANEGNKEMEILAKENIVKIKRDGD